MTHQSIPTRAANLVIDIFTNPGVLLWLGGAAGVMSCWTMDTERYWQTAWFGLLSIVDTCAGLMIVRKGRRTLGLEDK